MSKSRPLIEYNSEEIDEDEIEDILIPQMSKPRISKSEPDLFKEIQEEEEARFSQSSFGSKLNKIIFDLDKDLKSRKTSEVNKSSTSLKNNEKPDLNTVMEQTSSEKDSTEDRFKAADFFDFIAKETIVNENEMENEDEKIHKKRKHFRRKKKSRNMSLNEGNENVLFELATEVQRREKLFKQILEIEKEATELAATLNSKTHHEKLNLRLNLSPDQASEISSGPTTYEVRSEGRVSIGAYSRSKSSYQKEVTSNRWTSTSRESFLPDVDLVDTTKNLNVNTRLNFEQPPVERAPVKKKKRRIRKINPETEKTPSQAELNHRIDDSEARLDKNDKKDSLPPVIVSNNTYLNETSLSQSKEELKKKRCSFSTIQSKRLWFAIVLVFLLFVTGVVFLILFATSKTYFDYFLYSNI
jgi:hypothetical protein